MNNLFTILFHYLLPFFRQLHNFVFSKLFISLSKKLFQLPFTVFQGIEIFPLREFCKDWNKWISEGAMSGEHGGGIRTFQPRSNSFAWSSKKCVILLSWWKVMHFLLINYRWFLSSTAFSWPSWGAGWKAKVVVVHFTCPPTSSIPHYCTVSIFHRLWQFDLKTEHCHFISVENCMWEKGQGFLCLA